MYPYVIFDLDGTLLNTIDDLANAGNHVCRLHGWPTHSVDEFKRMVGNGIPKLVERFAPEGTGAPVLEQALGEFMAWYGVHKADQTAPYPGMLQAVRRLKEAGVSIAVLSNKADEMAGPVVEGYYPQIFPLVQGALTGIPTKPDPTLLHRLMERMGASQENTLFVGDSNVDIQTAKNGGLTSCGVLWGFRSRQELEQEGERLPLQAVLQQMYQRDRQDIERKVSPLRCAEDAVILDTTHLDLDQAEASMLVMIEELLKG